MTQRVLEFFCDGNMPSYNPMDYNPDELDITQPPPKPPVVRPPEVPAPEIPKDAAPKVEEKAEPPCPGPNALRVGDVAQNQNCLLYTSPSPRDLSTSRMPSSA